MTDEDEITEDKEIMRNTTTERCSECRCGMDKLVPTPYDELLYECTNKKECHFKWTVRADAAKDSALEKEKAESDCTCNCAGIKVNVDTRGTLSNIQR